MAAEAAERFPVLTFASGPTNSMRGAAFLSGLADALVIDIGGTTSDIGALVNGFPRQAGVDVEVAGVRTNFRMPDVLSVGLGGGSLVVDGPNGVEVGPLSVGFRLHQQSLVFGGPVLTATDMAVATGYAKIGDGTAVAHLDQKYVARATAKIKHMLEDIIDRVKLSPDDVPVILVGGGSILVEGALAGASEVIRPLHFGAANAVGAAIAQVSGEVDRVVSLEKQEREGVLAATKQEAIEAAVANGANRASVRIMEVDETPLAYLPGGITRLRVKAVGDLGL
jgi:N-methylhydantoinase A/oxoprolinase/acetone carboxylase beta subunit